MEKEVIPETNTPPKTLEYKTIGKQPVDQSTKETIPKILLPTKRLATILGLIFLAVIALALIKLPYDELLEGNIDIEIGYPLTFLEFGEDTIGTLPVKPLNLTLDLAIYLTLSYIIDILLSLMIRANTRRTRLQEGKGPKVYEAEKETTPETDTSQPKVPNAVNPFPNS